LEIEDRLWLSPFLKPLVKQELANRLSFKKDSIVNLRKILYFVLANDYKEYESLYNFFSQTEQVYQKTTNRAQLQKFLNTLSMWVIVFLSLFIFRNL
jgi:hypothetical protein